jgi:Winged helix DNA-binding domain
LTKEAVAAELSWPQVHAFRLQRHHLTGRAPTQDLAGVVGDIGGAQAQVMSAAELQIAVRSGCTVADVRDALWRDRSLVKTWLMRGTLHLARAEDLPIYTAAMGRHWIRLRPSWLKFMAVSEAELWALVDDIGAALDGAPLTREELIAIVGKGRSAHVRDILRSGWGGMLKPAARNGELCFGPSRGQSVTFVSPRKWLKSWREVDPDVAIVEMARRYLSVYGPATKTDFARWWGAWPGVGNAAWKGLASELVTVSVEGVRADALARDVGNIRRARVSESVQLLPLFDPYLMGHANRDHLFDRAHASRVSRTAGWISAVVLVDGSVAGTWTHTLSNKTLRIAVAPFKRLPAKVSSQVRERAGEMARALGATRSEVAVA